MLRMTRWIVLLVALTVVLVMAIPAGGITFGERDGDLHPSVGVLFGVDHTGRYVLCSGTLIAPTVFLTAAHCLDEDERVEVSFDTDVSDPNSAMAYWGTGHIHPLYDVSGGGSDWYDVGVVVLDSAVPDITPAELPPLGMLDEMKANQSITDAVFTTVGYGAIRDDKTRSKHNLEFDGFRYYTFQTYKSLQKTVLRLSGQPSTGDGGTCYGDSGGPHFLGGLESGLVVSITISGDAWCRATDDTYRLDTESARGFLDQYLVP